MKNLWGALVIALFAGAANAQLTIEWYTIDCGGGTLGGGAMEISGTVGQPDAQGPYFGGLYEVNGGFWVAPPRCGDIDFNNDGLFPDTTDIFDFLAVLSGAPCPTASCDTVDFNLDGVFPDTADIFLFLFVMSGGVC